MSLRSIQQANQLEKLQKEFGGFRAALSFLSEAAAIFDPQCLKLIVTELGAELQV